MVKHLYCSAAGENFGILPCKTLRKRSKHSVLTVLALKIDQNRVPEYPKSEISQILRSGRDEQGGGFLARGGVS